MAETRVTFDSEYQFCWVKNTGSGDCYISDRPNIQAEADDVAYLPAGEATLITMTGRDLYIVGDTVVECKAQNFAECPYDGGGSGGGEEPTLITKTVTTNGTYDASDDDADGYSSVTVNVAQDVELITRQQWDTLTTAQKQAKGLVGIQDAQSGFERGILVYGASYIAAQYLPYSDSTFLFCEATKDNFDASENTWGSGEHPVIYKSNEHKPTYSSAEDAVYVNSASDNDVVPYVDLTYPQHPFTAYAVLKLVSPSNQSRVLCAFAGRSDSQGIGLRGSPIYVAAWGDDTDTGITCSDYVVVAIRLTAADTTNGASGFVYDAANDDVIQIDKSPTNCGRYVAVCNADKFGSGYLGEQANGYVKYFGVIGTSESDATVEANMRNLYNQFIAE